MSTKLMKPDEKQSETANPDGKSGSTSASCQPPEATVQSKPAGGSATINVMTAQEASDLLARLQDILFLWSGSDNKIIGNYVMTALPIPAGVEIGKLAVTSQTKSGHDITYKVFCVNGRPVTE